MPHSTYPQRQDLVTLIASIDGIDVSDMYDYTRAINAAVQEWERVTEYSPFLNSAETVTSRLYDPPGPRTTRPRRGGSRTLRLRAGLMSVTSLIIGVDNPDTQQVLTVNQDFWLGPQDALYSNPVRPHTFIEFFLVQWGYPRSIQVEGVFGFCSQLPDDVWEAILFLAASYVAVDLLQGIYASPSTEKDDDVEFTQSNVRDLGLAWGKKGRDLMQACTLIY